MFAGQAELETEVKELFGFCPELGSAAFAGVAELYFGASLNAELLGFFFHQANMLLPLVQPLTPTVTNMTTAIRPNVARMGSAPFYVVQGAGTAGTG